MAIAFPGAEGYGANAQGARAGSGITVYTVTNLNNSGSGSFREACEANGSRVIVFNVAGVIPITDTIDINGDNVTILGQTAPWPGITIKRVGALSFPLIDINASDTIMRYLRFKHGEHLANPDKNGDAFQIGDDSNPKNIILDHCEFWWSTDEIGDLYQKSENLTLQWCVFGDPIHEGGQDEFVEDGHGYGIIVYRQVGLTMHHNLYINVKNRHPRIKTVAADVTELINNVHYNLGWNENKWAPLYIRTENNSPVTNVNIIDEYVIVGPDAITPTTGSFIACAHLTPGTINLHVAGTEITNCDGDWLPGFNVVDPNKEPDSYKATPMAVGHSYPVTKSADATAAYDEVISCAGVTAPGRDAYTNSRINGIDTCESRWLIYSEDEAGNFPTGTPDASWVDTDGDGIPDYFEFEKTGSNTGLVATDLAPSGYLWIEEWANSLVPTECTSETAPPIGEDITCPLEDVSINSGTTETYDLAATRVFVGDFDGATDYDYRTALRYQLDAGPSSTFSSANLRLYVTGVNGTDVTVNIYGVLEADAAPFGTEANTKSRITNLTTATVPFTIASTVDNAFITTPSIAPILQELTDQVGWVSGNSIMLVLKDADGFVSQSRVKIASANDGDTTCPKLTYTIGAGLVNANFTYSPLNAVTNSNVMFTDTSTATNGITNWLWTFGDGLQSTNQNPTHVYTTPGIYTVTLMVTGSDGSSTITKTIKVITSGAITTGSVANEYTMSSSGTVSLVNLPPSWIDLLGTTFNLMGAVNVSYNIFTGLGQAWDRVNRKMLTWNIDTGAYETSNYNGTISYDGGIDARLAQYGALHSGGRGEAIWDAWQAEQATLYPGWIIQEWPALFEIQYQTALTLV